MEYLFRLSFRALFLTLLALGSVSFAQDSVILDPSEIAELNLDQAVDIRTTSLKALDVAFFGPLEADELNGVISSGAGNIAEADRLVIDIWDKTGANIHRAEILAEGNWEEAFKSYNYGIKFQGTGVSPGSRVEATLYKGDKLVAIGDKILPKELALPDYTVEDLEIEVSGDLGLVSFVFTNTTLSGVTAIPQLTVRNLNLEDQKVILQKYISAQTVGAKSEVAVSYDFRLPTTPGVYELEIWNFNEEKTLITGALRDTFVIGGDFGIISNISLERLEAAQNENFEFSVAGAVENIEGNFELHINGQQVFPGTNSEAPVTIVAPLPKFQDRYFEYKAPISLREVIGSKFVGTLELYGEGKLTAFKTFDFAVSATPGTELTPQDWIGELVIDESQEVVDKRMASLVLFGILGLLGLVLIVSIFHFVKKRRTDRFMILLIAFSIWSSGAQASVLQNFWYHPIENWAFNPAAPSNFQEFRTMRFQGNIFNTLTQKGFFQTDPSRVIVKFYRAPDQEIFLEAFNFQVEDRKTYTVDVTIPTIVSEGDWGLQIYFLKDGTWYTSQWLNESTSQPNIVKVDSTPPTISGIQYDGQTYGPSDKLVWPGVVTRQAAKKNLLTRKKEHVLDRFATDFQRKNKIDERVRKIHIRNHFIKILKDAEFAEAVGAPPPPPPPGSPANAPPLTVENLVNGINTKTAEIDALTNELGIPVSAGSIFSTSHLLSDGEISDVNLIPSVPVGVNISCPLSSSSTASDVNQSDLTDCVNYFDTEISGLNTQIQAKRDDLRSVKTRFKKEGIQTAFICDDTVAGCDPMCNPASSTCDIDCTLNPGGCQAYQTANPTGYVNNCSGSPQTCTVDCSLDPEICRKKSFLNTIRGNFCDDPAHCDDGASRNYQVCDNVGNCVTLADVGLEIDWYDPVEPGISVTQLIRNKDNVGGIQATVDGQTAGDSLAADDLFHFQISAADPEGANATTHPTLFDGNVCGSGGTAAFFKSQSTDTFCTQKEVACALSSTLRGRKNQQSGGACAAGCPDGYLLDGNVCVPGCDYRLFDGCFPFFLIGESCDTSTWAPPEFAVPQGQVFVQTSNCGETRNWVGTKPITGSIKHFLEGKHTFGIFFYDTFNDSSIFSNFMLNTGFSSSTEGFTGIKSTPAATSLFTHQPGYSPQGGNLLKIESQTLSGGYAAWKKSNIPVIANRDYVLTYWLKTNALNNQNSDGLWPVITGNGSSPNIYTQYASSLEGTPSDLLWYRVEVPFTVDASTTSLDLEFRFDGQNNKVAFIDDVRIFERNWRYNTSKSWYSETKDDVSDNICDYMVGDGDGDPRAGADDRCGTSSFPEKAVIAFTSDGMYVFDAVAGSLWMSSLRENNPSVWGRFVWNALQTGSTFARNGKIYLAHRFNQGSFSCSNCNGAVVVGDLIADTMYSHRMSNCFNLSGYKGIGSSYSTYYPSGCGQHAYNWNNFIKDTIDLRNFPAREPWTTVMPANLRVATHQINDSSVAIIGGKTYVAIATDFGVTLLNKTDNTNQHIEFGGHNSSNYNWDYLPSTANKYRRVHLSDDGKLYYLWDYYNDSKARIWGLNDITTLPFNSSIISGSSVYTHIIQPNNASVSYPTTALPDTSDAFAVEDTRILAGGSGGFELFGGQFATGAEHPNVYKQRVNKIFAGAPLYGDVLGHWVNSVQDISGKANDLSNNGATVSVVAPNTDLQQFNFDGTNWMFTNDSDFNVNGKLTFGAWVKTTATEDTDGGYIMSKKDQTNTDFALYRDGDYKLRSEGAADTLIDYTLDGWDFVVTTFDGTKKRTYIDGQKVSEVEDTTTLFNTVGELVIGAGEGLGSGDGSCATKPSGFAGGDGSIGNPYQICSVDQLQNMSSSLSSHYKLIADIDASATSGWNGGNGFTTISGGAFTGTFDGDGFIISDYYSKVGGLFYSVTGAGASVKNVTFRNAQLDISSSNKGLVANQGGQNAVFENILIDGLDMNFSGGGSSNKNHGGLLGSLFENGTVRDVKIKDMTMNFTSGQPSDVGGLIGYTRDVGSVTNITIENFIKKGGTSSTFGGLIGSASVYTASLTMNIQNIIVDFNFDQVGKNTAGVIGICGRGVSFNNITVSGVMSNVEDGKIGGVLGSGSADFSNITINSLDISSKSDADLDEFLGGVVGNWTGKIMNGIKINSVKIIGNSSQSVFDLVGGVFGSAASGASITNVVVDMVEIKSQRNSYYKKYGRHIGGVGGYMDCDASLCTISNIAINGGILEGERYIGGVIGEARQGVNGSNIYIDSMVLKGNLIESHQQLLIGGIIGRVYDTVDLRNIEVSNIDINVLISSAVDSYASASLGGILGGSQHGGFDLNDFKVSGSLSVNRPGGWWGPSDQPDSIGGVVGFGGGGITNGDISGVTASGMYVGGVFSSFSGIVTDINSAGVSVTATGSCESRFGNIGCRGTGTITNTADPTAGISGVDTSSWASAGSSAVGAPTNVGSGSRSGSSSEPSNSTGDKVLEGAIAMPFVVNTAYTDKQIKNLYNITRDWFNTETKITLQGSSDEVVDVAFGDFGAYFVATGSGVTQFDLSGRVLRTFSTDLPSTDNVHIVSNNISEIDYKNGWLIIGYNDNGIEIVNIAPEVTEILSKYDESYYDPYFFY